MGRLDGTIALVTGGAKGLGRAACLRLANDGSQVAILDRDPAEDVVAKIEDIGGTAFAVPCDVSDEAQVESALTQVGQRFDRLDILVNNAGILSPRKPWREWTRAEIQR